MLHPQKQPKIIMMQTDDAVVHATSLTCDDAPKQQIFKKVHLNSSGLIQGILWFIVRYVQETRQLQKYAYLVVKNRVCHSIKPLFIEHTTDIEMSVVCFLSF